jgi:hypothetical protein
LAEIAAGNERGVEIERVALNVDEHGRCATHAPAAAVAMNE